MTSVKRTLAALGAIVAVGVAATPAAAATAGEHRTYIGFIAPTTGQAVQVNVNGVIDYCFRWSGGVNTGAPTDIRSGLEIWNPYFGTWEKDADWNYSEFLNGQDLTVQLFANADNAPADATFACKGRALTAERKLPVRPAVDIYYADFR